jgi:2-keto-4-pentenoate hydratase/2-oxohepta-3-ene-1,7-dioic acid hydratase in catechol pathway
MRLNRLTRPRHIICAAFTYGRHAKEFGYSLKDKKLPLLILKSPDSLIENGEPVVLPDLTGWFNASEPWGWVSGEVELAVVIKDKTFNMEEDEVKEHILGYTVFNDVTQRDLEKSGYPFSMTKSFPTFGPCGPRVVAPTHIPDPQKLRLQFTVNGKIMQDSSTSEMNTSVYRLVAIASKIVALQKGDIISTGTPPGSLSYRLQDGDVMEAEIEGIGKLTNPAVFNKHTY